MLHGFSRFLNHVLPLTMHLRLFSYKNSSIASSVDIALTSPASNNLP